MGCSSSAECAITLGVSEPKLATRISTLAPTSTATTTRAQSVTTQNMSEHHSTTTQETKMKELETLSEIQEAMAVLLPGSKIYLDRENYDEIVIRTKRIEPADGQQLHSTWEIIEMYEEEENTERVQFSITITAPAGPDAHKSAYETLVEILEQDSMSMSNFNVETIN